MARPIKSFTIVKVLVINSTGELLTLRRSQTDTRRPGTWDFPGGFAEPGEDTAQAGKRETQEEAGVTVDEIRLAYSTSEVTEFGAGTWLLYIAKIDDTPPVTLSYEHDDYKWVKPQELLNELTYGRHIAMLQYVVGHKLWELTDDTNA